MNIVNQNSLIFKTIKNFVIIIIERVIAAKQQSRKCATKLRLSQDEKNFQQRITAHQLKQVLIAKEKCLFKNFKNFVIINM